MHTPKHIETTGRKSAAASAPSAGRFYLVRQLIIWFQTNYKKNIKLMLNCSSTNYNIHCVQKKTATLSDNFRQNS